MVLTETLVDRQYKRLLQDPLFYLGLDSERLIGTVIYNYNRRNWEDLAMIIYQNVQEDGIAV